MKFKKLLCLFLLYGYSMASMGDTADDRTTILKYKSGSTIRIFNDDPYKGTSLRIINGNYNGIRRVFIAKNEQLKLWTVSVVLGNEGYCLYTNKIQEAGLSQVIDDIPLFTALGLGLDALKSPSSIGVRLQNYHSSEITVSPARDSINAKHETIEKYLQFVHQSGSLSCKPRENWRRFITDIDFYDKSASDIGNIKVLASTQRQILQGLREIKSRLNDLEKDTRANKNYQQLADQQQQIVTSLAAINDKVEVFLDDKNPAMSDVQNQMENQLAKLQEGFAQNKATLLNISNDLAQLIDGEKRIRSGEIEARPRTEDRLYGITLLVVLISVLGSLVYITNRLRKEKNSLKVHINILFSVKKEYEENLTQLTKLRIKYKQENNRARNLTAEMMKRANKVGRAISKLIGSFDAKIRLLESTATDIKKNGELLDSKMAHFSTQADQLEGQVQHFDGKITQFKDKEAEFEQQVLQLESSVCMFQQSLESQKIKLWGRLEYVYNNGEGDITQEIFLAECYSGDCVELPGLGVEGVRFTADSADEEILRLESPKGVKLSYWKSQSDPSDNDYIDFGTTLIKLVSADKSTDVRFHYMNFIDNLKKDPVPYQGEFLGREALIDEIEHCFCQPNQSFSFVLCGMSNSGKTSLVNQLYGLFKANYPERFQLIILDYQRWRGVRKVSFTDFEVYFNELVQPFDRRNGKQAIFFIDDYDLIYEEHHDKFDHLFHLFHDENEGAVNYILSGQRSRSYFKFTKPGYTLPPHTIDKPLKGFENYEDTFKFIDTLLLNSGFDINKFRDEDRRQIANLASHYPYFIMVILSEYLLLAKKSGVPLSLKDLPSEFIPDLKSATVKKERLEGGGRSIALIDILNILYENRGKSTESQLKDRLGNGHDNNELLVLDGDFDLGVQALSDMGFISRDENEQITGEPEVFFCLGGSFIEPKECDRNNEQNKGAQT